MITQAVSKTDLEFVKVSNEDVAKWLEKETLRVQQHANKLLRSCTKSLENILK